MKCNDRNRDQFTACLRRRQHTSDQSLENNRLEISPHQSSSFSSQFGIRDRMLFQPTARSLSPLGSSFQSQQDSAMDKNQQASSRILYDVPCKVCSDHSSGKHYGIFACDGCAGFFKRSIRRNRQYVCKAKSEGSCIIDKTHRNQCRACRLKRCAAVGMNKDAVQHERGPRNSTLRRQMSLYFKEHSSQPQQLSPSQQSSPGPIFTPTSSILGHTLTPPMSMSIPPPPPMPTLSPSVSSFSNGLSPPPPSGALPPSLNFADLSLSKSYQFHLSLINDARNAAAAAAALAAGAASNGSSPYSSMSHPSPPLGLLHAPMPKYPHEVSPPPVHPAPFSFMSPYLQHRLSRENISETAARLLFMNVRWAQHVPAFSSLPYRDQLLLLEESWRELFVLSASQFNLPVEMATLIDNPSSSVALLSELKNFQDTIAKFQQMNVDATEFACLRAILLLKTSIETNGDDNRELRDQAAITALQDQAQLTLSKYIEKAYPSQPSRFGKLLLLLPSLKSVSSQSIEELFFKKTIGSIPLERIICDMYKAGTV